MKSGLSNKLNPRMDLRFLLLGLLLLGTATTRVHSDNINPLPQDPPAKRQLSNYSKTHSGADVAKNQQGVDVPSLTDVLKVGRQGPILLIDTDYIEHLAHFDRERIPERVVHAKGCGALGTFKVTHDITKYTKACVFQPNTTTPILIRISTVTGEHGSADTAVGDPRGFAVKFYSPCGVLDIVGLNMEVFPIRDPLLFPSFVRSRKRNPQTNLVDQSMWWDFTSLRPETTFNTIQVFSSLGFPDGVRFMDAAGVHTYKFVNASESPVYVKIHYISQQGYKNLTMQRSIELAGSNPDYATEDLYNAIGNRDFPKWKMYIQVMTYAQAANMTFDPFDVTKRWSRITFPLIEVGILELNQNPDNFFNQIESVAFDPGNFIPGIGFSPDPMLQGRSFSYTDTQRYRLGANFLQSEVNRPLFYKDLHTYQKDGRCNRDNNGGAPVYFPNSYNGYRVIEQKNQQVDKVNPGDVDINRFADLHQDDFSQPREWYNNQTMAEKTKIAQNIAARLKLADVPVQTAALKNFNNVSPVLAANIKTYMATG